MSGGIAAYKACELLRSLVREGHEVIPIVTSSAERFVTAETFAALARRSVEEDPYPHLEQADLYVIAPLTANTMAKLAHGLADNVLTEAALAHRGPLVLAPAMKSSDYLAILAELVPELATATPGALASRALPSLRSVIRLGTARTPGMSNFDALAAAGGRAERALLAEIEREDG